jgi:hypothetical protein
MCATADLGDDAMAGIIPRRVTAKIDGDFVVFLIGMRINNWLRPASWLPTLRAMRPMLEELKASGPASGLLHFERPGMLTIIQYWRSFDQLEEYARAEDKRHWPAWVDFNRRLKNRRGDVGIWHETYLVRSGQYEAIYSGMPHFGLAKAGLQARVTEETESARQRLRTN